MKMSEEAIEKVLRHLGYRNRRINEIMDMVHVEQRRLGDFEYHLEVAPDAEAVPEPLNPKVAFRESAHPDVAPFNPLRRAEGDCATYDASMSACCARVDRHRGDHRSADGFEWRKA